jgi:hypothetical protein
MQPRMTLRSLSRALTPQSRTALVLLGFAVATKLSHLF